MELKDLVTDVELETVRGGNSITQTSTNGEVFGLVELGSVFSNGSPNTVDSVVSQANVTSQAAAIKDVYDVSARLSLQESQVFAGWPFL